MPHFNRYHFLILTTLLPLSSKALPDVLYTAEQGFALQNTVQIQQTPAEVWRTLTEQVDNWWPKDHSWWNGQFTIEASAGGCFCERAGERSAQHMLVSLVDPERLLRMTGGLGPLQGLGLTGALDWELTPVEGNAQSTQVTLTYRVSGYMPGGFTELAPVVDQVQALQLGALQTFMSNSE
ncbi:MAG: SRPBCC domain-containing protein [Gammaproteobacteria bacterium]|nr:SRPBCC domain-containing protein [Gammaproteobacteria bacterium]